MGKSTINKPVPIAMLNYQRVHPDVASLPWSGSCEAPSALGSAWRPSALGHQHLRLQRTSRDCSWALLGWHKMDNYCLTIDYYWFILYSHKKPRMSLEINSHILHRLHGACLLLPHLPCEMRMVVHDVVLREQFPLPQEHSCLISPASEAYMRLLSFIALLLYTVILWWHIRDCTGPRSRVKAPVEKAAWWYIGGRSGWGTAV